MTSFYDQDWLESDASVANRPNGSAVPKHGQSEGKLELDWPRPCCSGAGGRASASTRRRNRTTTTTSSGRRPGPSTRLCCRRRGRRGRRGGRPWSTERRRPGRRRRRRRPPRRRWATWARCPTPRATATRQSLRTRAAAPRPATSAGPCRRRCTPAPTPPRRPRPASNGAAARSPVVGEISRGWQSFNMFRQFLESTN